MKQAIISIIIVWVVCAIYYVNRPEPERYCGTVIKAYDGFINTGKHANGTQHVIQLMVDYDDRPTELEDVDADTFINHPVGSRVCFLEYQMGIGQFILFTFFLSILMFFVVGLFMSIANGDFSN